MKLVHRTASQCLRQPWKNGGGTTAELAIESRGEDWLWRLSLADVNTSGPFSDFAGYRRTIMLVSGRGMVLTFDQGPPARLDTPYRPVTFEGDWKTQCRLIDGPVKDMNFIWDRARADARVDVAVLAPSDDVRTLGGVTAIVHGLAGRAELDVSGRRIVLEQGDTLRIDDAKEAAMSVVDAAQCTAAIVAIGA